MLIYSIGKKNIYMWKLCDIENEKYTREGNAMSILKITLINIFFKFKITALIYTQKFEIKITKKLNLIKEIKSNDVKYWFNWMKKIIIILIFIIN